MEPSRLDDVLFGLAPPAALGAAAVILFGYFLLGPWRDIDRSTLRRGASILLPSALIAFFYWCIEPVVDVLASLGIKPRHVTLGSLYLAVLAGVAIALGHLLVGVSLFGLAAAADGLDGLLARKTGSGSKAGAFLDSFVDRASEAAIFLGLAWYGAGGTLTWVACLALTGSLLVSYARARGESLGASGDVGLMQRPERLLLLVVTLVGAPVAALFMEPYAAEPKYHFATAGVGLLALLSTWTAIRRAYQVYRSLEQQEVRRDDVTAPDLEGLEPDIPG